jgi:CubicO group peptidase (beta-lactamase class C family)
MRARLAVTGAAVAMLVATAPAHAAKTCSDPGDEWQRATPVEAGMDGAKLQDAIDYGSSQASFAVRVYRHGCLIGEDRAAGVNRNQTFESYSMAKSVTSLAFGRAMTLGLISPDDPVGSLVTETSSRCPTASATR